MTSAAAYKTVLLDLDHTLMDSDRSLRDAFNATMGGAGVDNPAQHYGTFDTINGALWKQVEAGTITPDEVSHKRFVQLVEEMSLDTDPAQLTTSFREGLGQFGELYPGTMDALEELAEHATLAMITNGLSDVQRTRIARLDLGRFLDATVISAEVGCTKPGTQIFDIAFEQLGQPAKDTAVMVGDSLSSDIRGGTNFGIATCWFNPHGKVHGSDDQVTHTVSDLQELADLLRT